MESWVQRLDDKKRAQITDAGLLIARIGAGALMMTHGWQKFADYGEFVDNFDPIGLGGPISLTLAVFAELFCAFAVAVGFLTRLATIPLIVTMSVAAFIVHASDPLGRKELALIYLAIFLGLALIGPGRYSVDAWLSRRR